MNCCWLPVDFFFYCCERCVQTQKLRRDGPGGAHWDNYLHELVLRNFKTIICDGTTFHRSDMYAVTCSRMLSWTQRADMLISKLTECVMKPSSVVPVCFPPGNTCTSVYQALSFRGLSRVLPLTCDDITNTPHMRTPVRSPSSGSWATGEGLQEPLASPLKR